MKNETLANFHQYVANTSDVPTALEVARAEGIYLYTPEGKKIIDFIAGICVNNVGHSAPEVVEAVQKQAALYMHTLVYGEGVITPQVQLATRLVGLLGDNFEKVYFCNSGANAIEGALKVAKKYTGRQRIVACHNSYHGSTHGAISITGNAEMKRGYGPFLPGIDFIHFNDFEDLAKIDETTACVVIEPIQGAGGVILPAEGYLQAVRKRCDEVGALMILDEIQTGFGRTGKLFAFEHFGFEPDLLVLAKALGGGMPMGAIVTSEKIISVIRRDPVLGLISTFAGHPICCAAGLASLEKILADKLMDRVPILERILKEELQHPEIQELRGKGLLYAIILKDYETSNKVLKRALEKGLLSIGFLNIDNGIRISPPLTMSDDEMREACRILREAMGEN